MNLFDSSALLSYLFREPGGEHVGSALDAPSACSTVNWAEVAQKARRRGLPWSATRELLLGGGLRLEPVTTADAERAAILWTERPRLCLADRLCLATADRLGATVWTADRAWGESETIRQVR